MICELFRWEKPNQMGPGFISNIILNRWQCRMSKILRAQFIEKLLCSLGIIIRAEDTQGCINWTWRDNSHRDFATKEVVNWLSELFISKVIILDLILSFQLLAMNAMRGSDYPLRKPTARFSNLTLSGRWYIELPHWRF